MREKRFDASIRFWLIEKKLSPAVFLRHCVVTLDLNRSKWPPVRCHPVAQ